MSMTIGKAPAQRLVKATTSALNLVSYPRMASSGLHYAIAAMLVLAALSPGGCFATDGEQCSDCDAKNPCKAGLKCVPLEGRGDRCVMPMKEGQSCSDPCWTCAEGLICNKEKKCEREIKAIACGERCDVPNVRCSDGNSCIEHNGNGKICGKSMAIGEKCADPCWVCQRGLTCNSDGVCALPKAKECGSCMEKECDTGLSCTWTFRGRICVRTVHGTGKCKPGCTTCETGFCDWISGNCWNTWYGYR